MQASEVRWLPLKDCSSVGGYELTVERYKHNWECRKHTDAWKWYVVYGGAVMSEGFSHTMDQAKTEAVSALPEGLDPGDNKICDENKRS